MNETAGAQRGYRPVSGMAVMALVAGVLSAVALVSQFFWVVPLLAIGLACLGLADVGRPGAEKAGRAAALIGLALAVGFGTQAVSAAVTSRWLVTSRARAAATLWLDALRAGRIDDARSMCVEGSVPALDQLAARITGCGDAKPRVEVVSASDDVPDGWTVRMTLTPCAAGPIDIDAVLAPSMVTRQEGAVERWMVVKSIGP